METTEPNPGFLVRAACIAALVTILLTLGLSWIGDHQAPPACTVRLFPDHSWTLDDGRPGQSPRGCAIEVIR